MDRCKSTHDCRLAILSQDFISLQYGITEIWISLRLLVCFTNSSDGGKWFMVWHLRVCITFKQRNISLFFLFAVKRAHVYNDNVLSGKYASSLD